jgi:hypothetical protein
MQNRGHDDCWHNRCMTEQLADVWLEGGTFGAQPARAPAPPADLLLQVRKSVMGTPVVHYEHYRYSAGRFRDGLPILTWTGRVRQLAE